jgi:monoamine oxidase
VVAVPLNALGAIEFSPPLSGGKLEAIALGQASRGIKIFIHARGEPVWQNAIRPGHPFGYLDTEALFDDGTQLMIGFGADAERCDATDLPAVQRQLDEIMPGYAIHRPGWYEHHHAAMRSAEGRVVLAGSDIADGWSGFIDGAIESGLRAGSRAAVLAAR